MLFDVVSHCNLSMYSTSQKCMQCLTNLIIFLVAVESVCKNLQSALLYRYFRQVLGLKYPASKFLPPCPIWNLWTPHCSSLWSPQKMSLSLFVISATLYCKSSSMLGGLEWMWARSSLFRGTIVDTRRHGDSIHTAEVRRPAALACFVLFVIMFFAIHQNMGTAQWGNTSWQNLTSQR